MGLGAGHWPYIVVILLIVLVIWGPGKLPDVGAGLGRAIREFRKASSETRDQFTNSMTEQPSSSSPAPAPEKPTEKPAEDQPAEEQKVSH